LLELQYYKETSEKQEQIIKNLILQLNKLNEEKDLSEKELFNLKKDVENAVAKAKEEETKRIKVEQEKEDIKVEKEKQILFHQKLLSKETKELLEYHHNIGISANAIEGHLINLKDDLNKGKMPNKQDLFELIENVSYETNKITSITNLATAANFNADADEIDADLDEFINQYISRVKQGKLKSSSGDNMQINIVNNSQNSFLYHFKPLEIAIVLDNLLSNSRKAKATEVIVTISNLDKTTLSISFKDNGNGIKSNILEKIFDFGFTTTSGSGLGLYHLRKIINDKYNGTIDVNKTLSKGAEFIINFTK
jgi:signal transduction histidine kinase